MSFPRIPCSTLTPGAQVAAAIEILTEIETGGASGRRRRGRLFPPPPLYRRQGPGADRWPCLCCAATPRRARLVGRADRQRRGRTRGPRPGPRRAGAGRRLAAGGGRVGCDGDRFRPAKLSVAEAGLVDGLGGRTLRHPEMPRAVANDVPEWLEPYLERVFGKGLEREMAALNASAPIDLRVNLLKTNRETGAACARRRGCRGRADPVVAGRVAARRTGAALGPRGVQGGVSSTCRTRARRSRR